MSTPTRQEIINAHNALDLLYKRAAEVAPNSALKTYVLKALPPKPQPTMAEVEWDDDKHYLAEAEHPNYGKVIMLGLEMHGLIDFFTSPYHTKRCLAVERETLTPTGRRYTLTEVETHAS